MDVIVKIPDALAVRLREAGADPESLALATLTKAANAQPAAPNRSRTPAEAAARMRASRAANSLPRGVTIRDLMTHGRA
jgi:hypothetical protein